MRYHGQGREQPLRAVVTPCAELVTVAITVADDESKGLEQRVAELDRFGVPEAEQQELFAIIGSTEGDIVLTEKSGHRH